MSATIKSLFLPFLCVVLLSACTLPAAQPDSIATLQAVYTEQSGTVQALQTMVNKPGSPTPVATLQSVSYTHLTLPTKRIV